MSYRDAVIFIIFTEVSKLKPDKVGLKDTYIIPIIATVIDVEIRPRWD